MFLDSKAHEFAEKLIKVFDETSANNKNQPKIEDPVNEKKEEKDMKRIIGGTDYKKYENIAKSIEKEEEKEKKSKEEKKEIMKMGCNNDLRKERQLMDKPIKDKIDGSKIFKTEGDDLLKQKKYEDAVNSYEKGLLQLFYTFSDNKEEDLEVESIKRNINLNCSFCLINQEKYEEALGYLNEALRCEKNNIKALYRTAFCYFKLQKFQDAKETINAVLSIDKDNKEFIELQNNISQREKELENNANQLYKKIGKIN